MARLEFYRLWWAAPLLHLMGAFPVHRQGVPVRAIKQAIRFAKKDKVVGVFVEGEVKRNAESVFFEGKIKRGACLIAQRSGRPVVPCVLLGAEALKVINRYSMVRRAPSGSRAVRRYTRRPREHAANSAPSWQMKLRNRCVIFSANCVSTAPQWLVAAAPG